MSEPMTPERLAAIEARNEARAPGKWRWGDWGALFGTEEDPANMTVLETDHGGRYGDNPIVRYPDDDNELVLRIELADETAENKVFIAACSEDIPALTAEVRRFQQRERELLVMLAWEAAELSEGQASKALGVDRVTARGMKQDAIAEGKSGNRQAT